MTTSPAGPRIGGGPVLRLRPRGRHVLLAVPPAVAGPALVCAGAWLPSSTLLLVGIGLTGVLLRSALILYGGLTEAWPDGLSNRLVGSAAETPWERVEGLVVTRTLFGRSVQVEERDGARISLAAPRSGLLLRSPAFAADLERLRRMPGGGRRPVPVRFAASAPVIVVQGALMAGFLGAMLLALVR
ncbi:hypothetical protein ACQP1W_19500 [Spirillospora sp. CA-255316]